MQTLTTKSGDEYHIEITLAAADRVQRETGIDVLAIESKGDAPNVWQQLTAAPNPMDNLRKQVEVFASLAQPDDPAAFGGDWDGESIDRGLDTLNKAIIDFFPSARRETLRAIIAKSAELVAHQERTITEKVAKKLKETPVDELARMAGL